MVVGAAPPGAEDGETDGLLMIEAARGQIEDEIPEGEDGTEHRGSFRPEIRREGGIPRITQNILQPDIESTGAEQQWVLSTCRRRHRDGIN